MGLGLFAGGIVTIVWAMLRPLPLLHAAINRTTIKIGTLFRNNLPDSTAILIASVAAIAIKCLVILPLLPRSPCAPGWFSAPPHAKLQSFFHIASCGSSGGRKVITITHLPPYLYFAIPLSKAAGSPFSMPNSASSSAKVP